MIVDRDDLEGDRARVERIEQRHVAHRRQRDADQIARAIGDLGIDEVEQDVEIVVVGVVAGELARQAAGVDAALDAPAHVEKTPAGAAVHVFVDQAAKAPRSRSAPSSMQSRISGFAERPFGRFEMVDSSRPISCQVSGDRRSRMTDAAWRAARAIDSAEP